MSDNDFDKVACQCSKCEGILDPVSARTARRHIQKDREVREAMQKVPLKKSRHLSPPRIQSNENNVSNFYISTYIMLISPRLLNPNLPFLLHLPSDHEFVAPCHINPVQELTRCLFFWTMTCALLRP